MMRKTRFPIAVLLTIVACFLAFGVTGAAAPTISANVGVSAAVGITDAYVASLMGTMQMMAVTSEVTSGNWDTMKGLLTRFQNTSIPLVAWFARPDGSYYTVDKGLTSENLSDRAYFPKVMKGQITVGDLVVSKSTGQKSMVITVPVEKDNKIVGALGVSVFLDQLSGIVAGALDLPNGAVLYAVNGAGEIALHTNTDLILENASKITPPAQSVSKTSSLLGWTFTLGLPK
jgi:hypothetical protein